MNDGPRLVAWELTARCNLSCAHCRVVSPEKDTGRAPELTTGEALGLIDQMSEFAPFILILTGGEPLIRNDFFRISRSAAASSMRVALASNGMLVDRCMAKLLIESGISRVSLSLDGADAATHDAMRGCEGSFAHVIQASGHLRDVRMPFQINTTLTSRNAAHLKEIMSLAFRLGAIEHHLFVFVPVGRGMDAIGEPLSPEAREELLRWLAVAQARSPIRIQVTCAPQYQRILLEVSGATTQSNHRQSSACLAGTGFVFVSATGEVYPCGYLPLSAGNVRGQPFADIWRSSPLLLELRGQRTLEGTCGGCNYRDVCGGCRARAYAATGRLFASEPSCAYALAHIHDGKAS